MPKIQKYQYSRNVNYSLVDRLKVAAQAAARRTAGNMERRGMREIASSRGEPCYLFKYTGKDAIFGFVVEGLGTKNRAMDTFIAELDLLTSALKSYGQPSNFLEASRISPYWQAAVDTCMMIFLDMAASGVMPFLLGAHYAVGASEWFDEKCHIDDYCEGMVYVCNEVDCTWGPGETPVLMDTVHSDTAVLDGAAIGLLVSKEPIHGQDLKPGNKIVFLESSGIQANYISGLRHLADSLLGGYLTPLSDGTPFGLALSRTTDVRYIKLIEKLISDGIKINYIVPIMFPLVLKIESGFSIITWQGPSSTSPATQAFRLNSILDMLIALIASSSRSTMIARPCPRFIPPIASSAPLRPRNFSPLIMNSNSGFMGARV